MTKVTTKQIAEAIYKLSREVKDSQDFAKVIAAYLIDEQRTKDLGRILREVERLRYERDGKLEIVATSKNNLDESVRRAITKMFPAESATVVEYHDDDLVGGVTIAAMDKWLDLSIRGKLNKLKTSNLEG